MASSEDRSAEREALEDLIRSEGWRIFRRRTDEEWKRSGYYARMNQVFRSDTPAEAMVIHRCSEEIEKAVTWPERRVTELKGDAS